MPPKDKQKAKGKSVSFAAPTSSDPRFAALSSDPRYRLPSKKHTHVKLDKRLGGILKDDAFSKKASVDRYGRKVEKGSGKKELQRLYRLASSDEEDEDEDEDELGSGEDDAVVAKELKKVQKKYDPARDGGFSTSESESESEDDSDVESEVDGELPEEADQVPMGEVTHRLAVVNLDWDNISAEDIMAVSTSFAPPEGRILKVSVYPSEFGRERMDREDVEGPPKEIFQSINKEKAAAKIKKVERLVDQNEQDSEEDDSEVEEDIKKDLLQEDTGAEFDSIALRKYQLDRLRYYYAVIECSSDAVAKSLYDNMDGQEYLSSANFFDMRFIPDETEFDNDKPRDSCEEVTDGYKPTEFTTDALMHSNVKLTWDADDTKRKEVQKRAFSRKEIEENDLLAYIGSASSEDEDEEEDELIDEDDPEADVKSTTSRATTRQARREALRTALGLDLEPVSTKRSKKTEKAVGDMQITFTPALSSAKSGASVFENEAPSIEETTAEKYVRKERERKQKRKERAKARAGGEDSDDEMGTVVKGPANTEQDDEEDRGFSDPFFNNPDEAIEEDRKQRRKQKYQQKQEAEEADKAVSAQRAELELMMMDDKQPGNPNKHFDIKAIEKAEKEAKKGGKNKKGKFGKKDSEALQAAREDNFNMNVEDPRFKKLFEDPAFAIDPTSHKFRDTKGTRAILEEKRRRGEEKVAAKEGKKRGRDISNGSAALDLVEKIKKKAKKS